MVNMGKVGLVTVTYNSSTVIDGFMESTLSQTYQDFILYIIDNQSKDDTLEKIGKYASDPRIVLITNDENVGVALGNNQGIIRGLEESCDYILLINNDTEFNPDLIETLMKECKHYNCDLIVPKIFYHDEQSKIWCAGGKFEPWMAYRNIHIGENQLDAPEYNIAMQIDYAPTCCMLIHASVFASIGLMDEKYFVYFDDTDFCLRAVRGKKVMYYTPATSLTHKVSSLTGGGNSDFTIWHMVRNRVYFIKKNIEFPLSLLAILYIQLTICHKLLLGKDSFAVFRKKQKAFIAGFKMVNS